MTSEAAPFGGAAPDAEVGATPYDRAAATRRDGATALEAATKIEAARRGEPLAGSGAATRSELSSAPSGESPELSQGYTPAPTDGGASVTSSRARRRRGVGAALGLVGAVAGLGALGLSMIQRAESPSSSQSADPPGSAAPSSSTSAAPPGVGSASPTAPSSSANSPQVDDNPIDVVPQASSGALSPLAPPAPSAPRVSSVRAAPQTSGAASAAPTAAPAASAVSAAPPVAAAASADDCTGMVKIASIGSYTVSGGPYVVQSPGIYPFRCGSYGLTAVSRSDPSQKKAASVVVRAGATSEVDLR